MGLVRWFTHNVADTAIPTHPDLKPLELSINVTELLARISATPMSRYSVERIDHQAQQIHLVRRTRLFRFADDVYLTWSEMPGGIRLDARSQSRIGKGDLGQNRRNILELFNKLRRLVDTP
jgi:uncharacterized protein (DUF1499 family)